MLKFHLSEKMHFKFSFSYFYYQFFSRSTFTVVEIISFFSDAPNHQDHIDRYNTFVRFKANDVFIIFLNISIDFRYLWLDAFISLTNNFFSTIWITNSQFHATLTRIISNDLKTDTQLHSYRFGTFMQLHVMWKLPVRKSCCCQVFIFRIWV